MEAPFSLRLTFQGAVLLFLLTPLFTIRTPRTVVGLPFVAAQKHAAEISSHSNYYLRMSAVLIKTVGGMCWGQDSEVRKALKMKPYSELA